MVLFHFAPVAAQLGFVTSSQVEKIKSETDFMMGDYFIYAYTHFINDFKLNTVAHQAEKFLEKKPDQRYAFNDEDNEISLTNQYKPTSGKVISGPGKLFVSKNNQEVTFVIPYDTYLTAGKMLVLVLPNDDETQKFAWEIDLSAPLKSLFFGKESGEFLRIAFDLAHAISVITK